MLQNPPADTPRIVARLAYEDPAAAVAFLDAAFGFRERPEARIASPDSTILLTELDVLDSRIMVGTAGSHDITSPKTAGAARR
jgi:uncharacterized glyoxalase superfamily protein PhnB